MNSPRKGKPRVSALLEAQDIQRGPKVRQSATCATVQECARRSGPCGSGASRSSPSLSAEDGLLLLRLQALTSDLCRRKEADATSRTARLSLSRHDKGDSDLELGEVARDLLLNQVLLRGLLHGPKVYSLVSVWISSAFGNCLSSSTLTHDLHVSSKLDAFSQTGLHSYQSCALFQPMVGCVPLAVSAHETLRLPGG